MAYIDFVSTNVFLDPRSSLVLSGIFAVFSCGVWKPTWFSTQQGEVRVQLFPGRSPWPRGGRYAGHGVRPLPAGVLAITQFPPPSTKGESLRVSWGW